MEAFDLIPPAWIQPAIHAHPFQCPTCGKSPLEATHVWINRRAPVYLEDYRKKWQEFYQCQCGCAWWGWSSDRPPSELAKQERPPRPPRVFDPFDDLQGG
jgi:hypothetical protein